MTIRRYYTDREIQEALNKQREEMREKLKNNPIPNPYYRDPEIHRQNETQN